MSADKRNTSPPRARRIPVPIALLFAANAATQFAIQAWLAYGFAAEVWELHQPLPWFAPVALDIFAINLMALTYMLRNAPLRQRIYAWFWLAVVIGAQVGASEGYADHEQWNNWGRAASLFPALFLAASLHALIIVARHWDSDAVSEETPGLGWWARRRRDRAIGQALDDAPATSSLPAAVVTARLAAAEYTRQRRTAIQATVPDATPAPLPAQTPPALPAAPEPPVELEAPVPPPLPRPASKPGPRRPRAPREAAGQDRPTGDPRRADVIKRCVDGTEDAKTAATDLGVNVRTAQLWVKAERERRARDFPAPVPADPSRTVSDENGGATATLQRAASDAPVP
jgi:hypothetical protein